MPRQVGRRRPKLAALVVALAVAIPLGASVADTLLERTREYVRGYEHSLQYLIADEVSEQTVAPAEALDRVETRRVTTGEMFVTFLQAEKQWTVVHDVATVDGQPVDLRADLSELARTAQVSSVARRVFALNARYNIGPVERNFNDPLLVLLTLNERHQRRFRFAQSARPAARGDQLASLAFRERERPTLIRNLRGGPVYSRGELVVDAGGSVRQARLTLEHDGIRAELVTDFAFDPRLSVWLPAEFRERYESNRGGRAIVTSGLSRYSNYRRFEATGRIVR